MNMKIKKDTFKGRWPFVVNSVVINNKKNMITVRIAIFEYALNGRAKMHGYADLPDQFWLDNPEIPGTKISLSDVINHALRSS